MCLTRWAISPVIMSLGTVSTTNPFALISPNLNCCVSTDLYNQDLTSVAGSVLYRLMQLNSAPAFARNFLIVDNYGRGEKTPEGEAYKQELFDSISFLASTQRYGINIAFADLSTLWDGVLSDPEAFGYKSTGACTLNDKSTDGACADPDQTLYWIPG